MLPEIYVWASEYVSASASGLFISLGLERERRGRRKGRKRKERKGRKKERKRKEGADFGLGNLWRIGVRVLSFGS